MQSVDRDGAELHARPRDVRQLHRKGADTLGLDPIVNCLTDRTLRIIGAMDFDPRDRDGDARAVDMPWVDVRQSGTDSERE